MTKAKEHYDTLWQMTHTIESLAELLYRLADTAEAVVKIREGETFFVEGAAGILNTASIRLFDTHRQLQALMERVNADIPAALGRADRWCTHCQPSRPISSTRQLEEYCERCGSRVWEVSGHDLEAAA